MTDHPNLIDWDYWCYLWIVFYDGQIYVTDINGWRVHTGSNTIGM